MWSVLKEVFRLNFCPSLMELSATWLQGTGSLPIHLIMFIFAGFAWTLWTVRNKMAIDKRFPKAPQKWGGLLKEGDRKRLN